MNLQILIPCKGLAAGKSRLAAVLDQGERTDLCRRLLVRTLDLATALAPAANVRVISSDPEAAAIATSRGHGVVGDAGRGLNAALLKTQAAVGKAPLLVLPIDLVFASVTALRVATTANCDVVIAPDGERVGTNLLFLSARGARFRFAFGPQSFNRHCQLARELKLRLFVLDDADLAFDLDSPADYRRWRRLLELETPVHSIGRTP